MITKTKTGGLFHSRRYYLPTCVAPWSTFRLECKVQSEVDALQHNLGRIGSNTFDLRAPLYQSYGLWFTSSMLHFPF